MDTQSNESIADFELSLSQLQAKVLSSEKKMAVWEPPALGQVNVTGHSALGISAGTILLLVIIVVLVLCVRYRRKLVKQSKYAAAPQVELVEMVTDGETTKTVSQPPSSKGKLIAIAEK